MSEEHGPESPRSTPQPAIIKYRRLTDRLLACISKMLDHGEEGWRETCLEVREKLLSNTFNLVVVGQFKRGKTHLINALMGAEILPVAVVPLTSIVTILTWGESLKICVYFKDGKEEEVPAAALADYVTETGNPRNVRNVREVLVSYPSTYLKDGVRLIDTPGVGSVYLHNTDVAYQYLPKSDAALFLLSVDQPAGRAELDFLRDVREYSHRIFFLLNKIDYLSEKEIGESIDFARRTLLDVMEAEVRVFPVSAKLALEGKLGDSREALEKSGLGVFSEVLNNFLLQEKGRVLIASVCNNLLRSLSQSRLGLDLERETLTGPVAVIQQKISAFQARREEVLLDRRNFDVLLDNEVNTLIRQRLDRDLAELKGELIPKMESGFEAFLEEHHDLALKELNEALENWVTTGIEQAFTNWRTLEEDLIAGAFEEICDRFAGRVNDLVDELLSFSSQLFSVEFEPIKASSSWKSESSFYFKMKEDPVGLDLLAGQFTEVLPGYISRRFQRFKAYVFRTANRMIVGKRKRHMLEAIEMQSGRIRHDFLDRLQKSRARFRADMLRRMEATVSGVSEAIEKGMKERVAGEKQAAERQAAIENRLRQMESIREEIVSVVYAATEI